MASHAPSYLEQDPSDHAVIDDDHTASQESSKAARSLEGRQLQECQGSQEDLNHAKEKRSLGQTIAESETRQVEVSHPDAIQADPGIPTKQRQYRRPDSAGIGVPFAFGRAPDRRQLNPVRASYTVQHPSLQTVAPTYVSLNETHKMNELGSAHKATARNRTDTSQEQAFNGKPAKDDYGPRNDEPVPVEMPNPIRIHRSGNGLTDSTKTVVMQEDFSDGSPIISHAPEEITNAMQILTPFPGSRLNLLINTKDQILPNADSAQKTQHSYRSRQPTPMVMEVHPAVRQHRSISPERRDQPQSPGKIRKTKSRRRTKLTKPTGMVSLAETQAFPSTDTSPTQEDLLRILIMRTQEESRTRERAKAIQQAKDVELGDSKQACSQLKAQLQALQDREKAQAAQLSKYQKVLPGWKANLHKLQDYFKGLTNDHNKLKTDATAIRKECEGLYADKTTIETSLQEAHEVLAQKPSDSKTILTEARHQMDVMEQTIQSQRAELNDEANLLDYERDRNQRLEDEMSKISTNQQQMLGMILNYREVVTGKLDQLLKSNLAMPAMAKAVDEKCIQTMLDRCVVSLKEFQSPQTVKREDLQRLNELIKAYADRITRALQHSTQANESSQEERSGFENDIKQQLDALSAGIKTEKALSEQVIDLREMRASIRERLQSSDSALVAARQSLIGLQGREHLHLEMISTLKADLMVLRSTPAQDTAALLRIRDLESTNTALEAGIAKLQSDLAQQNEDMKCHDEEAIVAKQQLESINFKFEEVKAEITKLEAEKADYENLARSEKESLSAQYLKATNVEKAILKKEYLNELAKLRRLKDATEAKALHSEDQLQRIRAEKGYQNEGASQLRAQIASLEIQGSEQAKLVVQLQEKLQQAIQEANAKDTEIQNIKEANLETNDELGAHLANLKTQGTEYENLITRLQKELCQVIEEGQSKDAEYQILEEENKDLKRKSEKAEQELATKLSESLFNNDNLLAQINTMCKDYDERSIPQTEVKGALGVLSAFLVSAKEASQRPLAESMSLGQDNLYESYGDPLNSILDEVELLDSQDRGSQASIGTQSRRKANRHNSTMTNASSEMLFQDTQVEEETTIHRSVKKTTSSRGNDMALMTTPSHQSQQPNNQTPQVSLYVDNYHHSIDSESSPGDMSGYFPPTPLRKYDLGSDMGSLPRAENSSQAPPFTVCGTRQPTSRYSAHTETRSVTQPPASQRVGTTSVAAQSTDRLATTPRSRPDPSRVPGPSVLKEPKSLKRNATTAGLGAPKGPGRKRAVSGLGPVIENSQSSNQDPSIPKASLRGRKSQRKQPKDKYERRFNNED